MSIFQKLFGQKRPTLKNDDIPNFEKVAEFVMWFIKNEPIANAISNRSSNTFSMKDTGQNQEPKTIPN
jgi:hypothetical protein